MKSVITSGETLYYAKRLIYMRNPNFTIQKGNRFYQKNGAAYLKAIKAGSNKGINRVCDVMPTLYKLGKLQVLALLTIWSSNASDRRGNF